MIYSRFRCETGEEIGKITIGGKEDTIALDIVANIQGAYILCDYAYGVSREDMKNTVWKTITSSEGERNIGIVWIGWND